MSSLVIFFFKLLDLSILLSLNISLPLLQGLLRLPLEALVRGEVCLLAGAGILANLLVHALVQLLQTVRLNVLLNVAGKLRLVLGVVLLFKVFHVLPDVSTE